MRAQSAILSLALLATAAVSTPAFAAEGTPSAYMHPALSAGGPYVSGIDVNRPLQPGDYLRFKIDEDRDNPIDKRVSPAGEISIELLPEPVKIAGLTIEQASAEIKQRLENEYYHHATVRLWMHARGGMGPFVSLSGYVARVGEVPLPTDKAMTVGRLVLMYGGVARRADKSRVNLIRTAKDGTTGTIRVNLDEIFKHGRTDLDVVLQDGDRIYVPDTFIK